MIYMEKSKSFFNRFYPNYVFESVEKIPYEVLEKEKIKLIIFDMDNTLVDNKYTYTEELKEWMQHIKDKGIKLYILSNSPMEKKVKRISNELGIKYIYNAKKPFLKGFKAVVENSKVKKKNVMMIGDQLFTDVWGGNRFGIKTILVRPIATKEAIITKIKRPFEKIVLKKYYKKRGEID